MFVTLNQLGFTDYAEYLESELWADIRRRTLQRDHQTCRACGLDATQVHHRYYDHRTLHGLSIDHLVSLCRTCHEAIHLEHSQDGTRQRSLKATNRELKRRMKERRRTIVLRNRHRAWKRRKQLRT